MKYQEELIKAMTLLAKENYIFIGQSVLFPGTGLFHTIKHIPDEQKIETPIFEDTQLGISIGMSLEGLKVCSIYPRMDFLILALNQLVNHLDKMEEMSDGEFKPKVIIRTAVGSVKPLFPGPQHNQNHFKALWQMLTNVDIIELKSAEDIIPQYKKALENKRSVIIIEYPDLYNIK